MTLHEERVERLNLYSHDGVADRTADIMSLFPELRSENGKIDFEKLKILLGQSVEVGKERYGMNWPGKSECFKTIQAASFGTLLPMTEQSVNFSTSKNVIIEGDNLEVLKLLQRSYLGKVKMIYIDPPYNTGNDFIYPDNYAESLKTYLEFTGQVDSEGRKFGSNTESEGRFHSKWMNMMFPRLYLARNLLRHDGLLFISIDDHEIDNLLKICKEIYGEESLIGTMVWRRRQVSDNRNLSNFSTDHEYVVVVARSSAALAGAEKDLGKYTNPDNDPRGPWMSDNLTGLANAKDRPNLHYDIENPQTGVKYPPLASRGWCFERSRMQQMIADGRILWPAKPEGRPRLKRFLADIKSHFTGFSSVQEPGYTTDGTRELEELFGEKILGFPKPLKLIDMLLEQATAADSSDIVLDFFAGSATTAQAVMERNRADGGNRQFVLVQLPEPTGRPDFETISEITRERVRKVIHRLVEHDKNAANDGDRTSEDLGFRAFRLGESNFVAWDGGNVGDTHKLERQLELFVEHIRADRSSEDILYELLLKSGFPLTTSVTQLSILKRTIYSVADGALLICLEADLNLDLIKAIAEHNPERVICLDRGFARNDQLKANAIQIFKAKGVQSFRTV